MELKFININELMEAQVDLPLRNLFGNTAWWRNCYAGLTLVHRSGIIGQVDILGNVSGGSDALTGHLECSDELHSGDSAFNDTLYRRVCGSRLYTTKPCNHRLHKHYMSEILSHRNRLDRKTDSFHH